MISKKGFLFTISIILFSTTLILYTQSYSESILNREMLIIENYKLKQLNFISDDISTDILKILKIDFDSAFENEIVNVSINGELPVENISDKLIEYNNFLNNFYFTKQNEQAEVDFSGMDNNFIIEFITNKFIYDFDDSIIYLNEHYDLLDLNIFVQNSDLNFVESNFSSGDTLIKVNYFDDQNIVSFTESINLDSPSFIKFIYNDNNITINFGENNQNYFSLDSEINSKINYFLKVQNSFDANFFDARTNVLLKYRFDNLDSNSFVKVN